ncbi:MAG: membrane-bound lytic murein transglycosylase MltF [Methylococcales bacterium]|nr:membrane-bound lytic murein transglycosylase MltF [Methylococcales bacterium]
MILAKPFKPLLKLLFIVVSITSLSSCDNYSPSHKGFSKLEQIKLDGTLNILTHPYPTTYYKSSGSLTGLEFDLIMLFANRIGVKANFIIPNTFSDIINNLSKNQADIAAAGLTITPERKKIIRFTSPYQSVEEQVVFRSGTKRPKSISDLSKGILEVAKGTSHIESLKKLKVNHPKLSWNINAELNTDSLMYLVNEGLIDYTIADSHVASSIKQFYPKLYTAFNISNSRQIAWATPLSVDNSLYDEINLFFEDIKQNKTLDHLLDIYYGETKNLGYIDNCTFRRHIKQRLPAFKSLFQQEAKKHNLDWKLVAAIGYQESHWLASATSPTGVKGIMMLTKKTAKQVGVNDRTDPVQSITGGALYFKQRLKKVPSRIHNPDRTWFALASYNIGFGHFEDARVLTEKRKGNPDKWLDVKTSLPLLSKKKWYKQTRHGYARGNEPVRYVENIRGYYNLLTWLTEENQIKKSATAQAKP